MSFLVLQQQFIITGMCVEKKLLCNPCNPVVPSSGGLPQVVGVGQRYSLQLSEAEEWCEQRVTAAGRAAAHSRHLAMCKDSINLFSKCALMEENIFINGASRYC